MTMLRRVATCLVWLGVMGLGAGCASFPHQHKAPLNAADYALYAVDGTAVITGDAFVTLTDGHAIKASHEFVFLIPATAYTREWFEHVILAGQRIDGIDPRSLRVTRATLTNGEGRFTFLNVPQGDYYLTCAITWETPSFHIRRMEVKRGVTSALAYATARVGPGERTSVHVTRRVS